LSFEPVVNLVGIEPTTTALSRRHSGH